MGERLRQVIEELRSQGFAKLSGAVNDSIVTRLQAAAATLAGSESESWSGAAEWFARGEWKPTHFADRGDSANYYDSLGVDERFDQAAEDLLETPVIRALLDEVVGTDRRMWFVQLRWARPGAPEYFIHQDVYGELGLCVYLSDHPDEAGSMVLWPRSHRWPRLLEAFPLALPAWMKGCLGRVDGVAGDVCVFFNKTWHGRTSASGSPRLVMLISFAPPGPRELARRLPEAARAGLGPELRKVTSPDAARPFGQRPPADPPLSSSFELPENCPFTEEVAQVAREYAWDWSRFGGDGDARGASPLEALRRYKGLILQTMLSAVVPRGVTDSILEDFRRRAAFHGFGPRTHRYLGMCVAQWNGELDRARDELDTWRELPRDTLCDSPEREQEAFASLLADAGDDAGAVRAAQPLLEGRLSNAVPDTAWSTVLLPHVKLGRFASAARTHARGYAAVRGNPAHLRPIGRHLEYLALLPDPEPALALIGEHRGAFAMQPNAGSLWHFWSGAWTLFGRLQRAGVSKIGASLPRLGEHHEVARLAEHFRALVAEIAGLLDGRNGNDYRRRLVAEIEARLEWEPLPSRPEEGSVV